MGETTNAAWREFVRAVQEGKRHPFSAHWKAFREAYTGDPVPIAWWPDPATRKRSNLLSLLEELGLEDYPALHRFSVANRQEFWARVLARLGVVFETEPEAILDLADGVKHPRWLKGAELEITRSCFTAPPGAPAILYGREGAGHVESLTYAQLQVQVNRFANGLLARGFAPGDGVALYMPMTPECVAAYLGTVRAGCRVVSVADSFSADELRTRVEIGGARAIVTVSSYRRGGRVIDLYGKVRTAAQSSTSLPSRSCWRRTSSITAIWPGRTSSARARIPPRRRSTLVTSRTCLFSSGTTASPKAISWTEVTPLKAGMDAHFHQDVHPRDVVCWPTNVGWMMGPWLIYGSLLNEATMALYEGAPTGGGFTRFVREAEVDVLGVVPSLVRACRTAGSVDAGGWPSV